MCIPDGSALGLEDDFVALFDLVLLLELELVSSLKQVHGALSRLLLNVVHPTFLFVSVSLQVHHVYSFLARHAFPFNFIRFFIIRILVIDLKYMYIYFSLISFVNEQLKIKLTLQKSFYYFIQILSSFFITKNKEKKFKIKIYRIIRSFSRSADASSSSLSTLVCVRLRSSRSENSFSEIIFGYTVGSLDGTMSFL